MPSRILPAAAVHSHDSVGGQLPILGCMFNNDAKILKLVAGHSALVERSAACFTFGWSSLGRAAVPLPSHFVELALWYLFDPFPDVHKTNIKC